jgi:hypothetical protein
MATLLLPTIHATLRFVSRMLYKFNVSPETEVFFSTYVEMYHTSLIL